MCAFWLLTIDELYERAPSVQLEDPGIQQKHLQYLAIACNMDHAMNQRDHIIPTNDLPVLQYAVIRL